MSGRPAKRRENDDKIHAAIRPLERVIEWLKELDTDCSDNFLMGSKRDPVSSAEASFFAGSACPESMEQEEISVRLKIVLDAGELLELAKWAQVQAIIKKEDDDCAYLELHGGLIFDFEGGVTDALLRSLLDAHCQSCEIEIEIGTKEKPYPVPDRFHSCRRKPAAVVKP